MKRYQILKPHLAFLVISIIFLACSESPEEAGKDLAQKKYECHQINVQDIVVGLKRQLIDLKEGKIKSKQEFLKRSVEYSRQSPLTVENLKNCNEALDRLGEEIELNFPKPDDRQTVRNSFNSYYKILERDLWKERDAIEDEIKLERDKLP